MVDFLPSEKTQNGPFFADTHSKNIFFTKGTHIQMENVYFFAKTMFGYGEFEGACTQIGATRFWPKMGRFTRPACNAKHTYACTRVLRPVLIVATTLKKRISSDVRPKNWPEQILGLCPTAPEGVGVFFF